MKQITLLIFLLSSIFKSYSQDLRITEIMYNPANLDSPWEWVEVYNAGTEIVDLTGFVIDDNSGAENTVANIPSGTILPGSSAVLYNASAISEAEFLQVWGNVDLIAVTRWSALNNSGDSIGIWNSFDNYSGDHSTQENTIEQVTYAADGDWPEDDGISSIYLSDLAADRNIGTNWLLSAAGAITPIFKAYESRPIETDGVTDLGSPGTLGVLDNENPVIICPDMITRVSDVDSCGATVSLLMPTATDNISTQFEFQGIRNDGLDLTDLFPLGITTITWSVSDEAGNQSESCEQIVSVTSDVLPTINCPNSITVTSVSGDPVSLLIEFATATTACDQEMNLSFTRSDNLGLQQAFPIGSTTITWTALDASGNQSECNQTITVLPNNTNQSNENAITSFLVSGQIGETTIDEENHTLFFVVPFGTDVTALTPTIEVSEDASILPLDDVEQDFSNPVMYTVTAEDGTAQIWTTAVVIEEETNEDLISITNFVLVNADTNEDLFPLEEGMQIDMETLPTLHLDIRANSTVAVESTYVSLVGSQTTERTENEVPYALFGDSPTGNYYGNDFTIGSYTVFATPYQEDNMQGIEGETKQISFELYQEVAEKLMITEFILVNADTNEDLFPLEEGMQIDMEMLPTLNLDVRANTTSIVESVRISLSGDHNVVRTENVVPYALFGDLPAGNYNGNSFSEGQFMVSGIPYADNNLQGDTGDEYIINFEIFKDEVVPSIMQFTLINADTNEDLFFITEGMEIDINSLPTRNLDIRADASEIVKSVRFDMTGALVIGRTENVFPYAMFGDFPANNYVGNIFTSGDYNLTAIGYTEFQLVGEKGEPLSVNFKIIDMQLSAKKANSMSIFPNPASSVTTLKFDAPETLEMIYLYDMMGREVAAFNAADVENNGTYVLNVESFPEGILYIKSYSHNGSFVKQIVIKK